MSRYLNFRQINSYRPTTSRNIRSSNGNTVTTSASSHHCQSRFFSSLLIHQSRVFPTFPLTSNSQSQQQDQSTPMTSSSLSNLSLLLRSASQAGDFEGINDFFSSLGKRTHYRIINEKDPESGTTALMLASKNDHWRVVKELLKRGANVSARDSNGMNAFNYAIAGNAINAASQLHWLSGQQEIPMSMLEGSEDKMDPFRKIREGKNSRTFERVKEEVQMKKEISESGNDNITKDKSDSESGSESKSSISSMVPSTSLSPISRNSFQPALLEKWKNPRLFGNNPPAQGQELQDSYNVNRCKRRRKKDPRPDEYNRDITRIHYKSLALYKRTRLKHIRALDYTPKIDNSNCGFPKWKDNIDNSTGNKDAVMLESNSKHPILNFNLRSPDLKFQGGANPGYWPLINAGAHVRPVKAESRVFTRPSRSRNRPNEYWR